MVVLAGVADVVAAGVLLVLVVVVVVVVASLLVLALLVAPNPVDEGVVVEGWGGFSLCGFGLLGNVKFV